MSWVLGLLKSFVAELPKMLVSERANDYRTSFIRNQELMANVELERSRALMTFSIAGLAALAALNNNVFIPHPKLSIATIICFVSIIVFTIMNYLLFNKMLVAAQEIITANYKKSLTAPLGAGMDKVKYNHLANITGWLSTILFVVAILLFIVLITSYILGVGK